ncbi:hypothetical protein [Halobacillus karajensis]|uniref:hypothetical protein n=1 Tax=Halobacillus karajensis TaxID=195088 RepID=UPI00045CB174|nr:hypothetical protein [Halobacillus karajensis]CDQ21707.1 hypothetical protein BN982_04116 [Halobacillus karajensis]
MANKERGEVVVELDQERVLSYTLNSLIYAEENGVDLQNMSDEEGNVKLKDLRTILYAGLMHYEELTPEDVGRMIDLENLKPVSEALNKAFGSVGK